MDEDFRLATIRNLFRPAGSFDLITEKGGVNAVTLQINHF